MKRYQLMVPGPVDVDPQVLQALSRPLVAHFGQEWANFYKETVEMTKDVFQTKGDVFLLVGSGSAGLDAIVGSSVGQVGKALILSNGWFGERLYQIARSYTAHTTVIRIPPDRPIEPEVLEASLQQNPVDVVLVTHCETSTGVLNPIKLLGAVCEKYNSLLVVDAVSSLGGAPLPMDDWKIDACVTATQKCLETPAGLSPIAVSQRAWERIEKSESRGWYLNLRTWKEFSMAWSDWHPHPVTVPTGLIEAFRLSLERIRKEGLIRRFERHAYVAGLLRQGLRNLKFKILAPEDYASPTVTAFQADSRISIEGLQHFLQDKYNILIAGGVGDLRGKIFRIGHMGPSATSQSIISVLFGIVKALQKNGVRIRTGQAFKGF